MANDPFRVLGLGPQATTAEIKRAYRALAKANHPDSAGEAALPRFLAIQAAYEQLVTGKARGSGRSRAGATNPEPWRADPARAQEARGGSRAGADRPGASRPGAGRPRSNAGRPAGQTGTTGGQAAGGGTRRRSTRKATFGSTTYDEAHDPSDPTWQGAAWYGQSSGEYWTVNPREYADPRKHGPEYQARAADRAARARARFEEVRDAEDRAAEAHAAESEAGDARAAEAQAAERRTAEAARARAAARAAEAARARAEAADARHAADARRADASTPRTDLAAGPGMSFRRIGWSRFERGPFRRYVLAVAAWPPLGIAAASVIGRATGCAVFSASCTSTAALLPWLAQMVILLALAAVPALARLLVGGTAAVLVLAFPAAAALSAGGATYDRSYGPAALMAVLGLGWIAGVALTALRTFRTRSTA